jgi:glucose/arabinose dehydrogenase
MNWRIRRRMLGLFIPAVTLCAAVACRGESPSGGGEGAGAYGGSPSGGSGGEGGPEAGCRAPRTQATVGNACPGSTPPPVRLVTVVSGLEAPVYVAQAPGDPDRLFVVERGGRIRVVRDGAIESTPFLDLRDVVRGPGPSGEQGLLGLAFDPDYARTGRLFVNYTGQSGVGDTVIAAYEGPPGESPSTASRKEILVVSQLSTSGNHNGGMIAFGPDGCLYIGMGDGGGSHDPGDHGQNPATQLGSMLRIDVDRHPARAAGNPSIPGADPHAWSIGWRNPWRFSFDRQTGDLYAGDVGQNDWEEVNVEPAGRGGRNYGWKIMEGTHCRGGGTCARSGLTLPAVEHENRVDRSVIGGYVYRGARIPGLVGRYVYGDYASRRMYSFVYAGEENGQPQVCDVHPLSSLTPGGDISSFGEDLAGELYVVTLQGTVYRIEPG